MTIFKSGIRLKRLFKRAQHSETALSAAGAAAASHIRWVRRTSSVVREPKNLDAYFQSLHPGIVAMWHGQFLLLPLMRPKDIALKGMVAKHADGELIARTLSHFDIDLIRGAGAGAKGKDRGGAGALRAAAKALQANISVAMTADIPPGPARAAGLGIVILARLSGKPIVPVAIATNRLLTLPTWSRFTMNLPFSRLAMVAGDAIYVPRDADETVLETCRQQVEAAMNAVTARAYDLVGSNARRVLPPALQPSRKSGVLLSLYRAVTIAARPAAMPFLRRRAAAGKEMPARLTERLGIASLPRPEGRLFWFHAASVGETNAILPLIDELKRRHPSLKVLVTTITVTSAEIAAARLQEGCVHQFVPLDNRVFVRRFLDHWKPDLGLFTESEIWPNLIVEAAGRNVPLVLVNARMSQRSCRRWAKLSSLSQPVFSQFDLVLAQNRRIAKRLTGLGARRTSVSGNLKYDAPPPPVDAAQLDCLRRMTGGRPVFLAASTHPGEDEAIAAVHRILSGTMPTLLTIVAPRHPSRAEAIGNHFTEQKIAFSRRSSGGEILTSTQIYLADTIGELGLFYALAPLSFIGGSLVSHGGQNPIEAIKLGSAVLSGAHTFNFAETYEILRKYEACKVIHGPDDLAGEVLTLFENPESAEDMKRRAVTAIGTLSGALDRTLDALKPYLETLEKPLPPHATYA